MKKLIAGILVGLIVIGAVLAGQMSRTSAAEQPDESEQPETLDELVDFTREEIIAALEQTGEEIQDEDISRYYQLLIEEYNLDEETDDTDSGISGLPDLNHITRTAMTLPLQEAGKNIQDEEIAGFYYELMEDAGWEIER